MPKHDKPVLDVQAVRANRDHYRHWETRFHDYCLLEGYRNPAKNRTTETADHFIAAKRPFELAVLRSAIPASEWNTLDDVIASKIPTEDAEKPWIWLQHIKEHYVGASTLMQDRYHFWSKMSQATQTSISAWETTVRTAAGRCSFGVNADEFMRDKFVRFEQHHVKLNLSKMKFLVRKATFMGHIITTDGLQPNPVTVQAILNMPTPKDKQGVRRFLGAINYLSKFCPQLSSVTQPMRNLTKEDTPFLWSAQHQQAFDEAKALATSAPCLAYYDVNAPVVLQVDASDYGLGAALLQPSKQHSDSTFDESSLQPIAYSSKSLTPTEQRYAQIEKECLAIVEAFNKFDQWLLGKSDITVHTDHQPLQSIFQKDLASAPKRLQKMMLCLQRYNFTVVYRKGSSLHLADTLSRAPYQDQATSPSVPDTFQVFQVHLAHLDPTSPALTDTTRKQLRRATTSCQDMQLLEHHIIHGWPPTKEHLPHQLQAFWHFRDELSVADSILLKSTRAIVPTSLRPNILNKIHQSHRGPEYCLRFARDAVFWPNMSKDIEAFCHSCPTCAQYGKQAPTEPMLSHPTPSGPWQLVSQDLFEFEHKHYLITVDHYSDFYELDQLTNTQSTTIVDLTCAVSQTMVLNSSQMNTRTLPKHMVLNM